MFAIVDFDRQTTQFFTSFQAASDAIAAYPVQQTVVVVDLSENRVQAEKL
jgi:hypothetical protein